MDITEVRVKLVQNRSDKLLAFSSVTIGNEFVVRDLKIIKGTKGPFVAMPSRKLTDRCNKCGGKNHLRANYCNDCGARLRPERAPQDEFGRVKLHADIAHPINSVCREELQKRVLLAFKEEQERASQPGYRPRNSDCFEDEPYDDTIDPLTEPVGEQPDEGSGSEQLKAGDDDKGAGDGFGNGIFT